MDFFFFAIVLGVVALLSVLGWLAWLVFFVWMAKSAMSAAERELTQTLPALQYMLSQVPQGSFDQLNPQEQARIQQMLMQTQTQMDQLDDLARQRYDLRVSELSGMAAQAGIDWSPGS